MFGYLIGSQCVCAYLRPQTILSQIGRLALCIKHDDLVASGVQNLSVVINNLQNPIGFKRVEGNKQNSQAFRRFDFQEPTVVDCFQRSYPYSQAFRPFDLPETHGF